MFWKEKRHQRQTQSVAQKKIENCREKIDLHDVHEIVEPSGYIGEAYPKQSVAREAGEKYDVNAKCVPIHPHEAFVIDRALYK